MEQDSSLDNLEEVLGMRDYADALGEDIRSSCGRSRQWVQRVMTLQAKKEDERVVALRVEQDLLFQSRALVSGIGPSIQEWGALEWGVHVHASRNRLEEAYFRVEEVEDHVDDMGRGSQHMS
mmetsp:Transcript_8262/g.13604  ORF Transcript_8262/g.13604 Transcript_8262/m.13604 type:complete len:122 (+) Transcript_8262:765-1130(+)